MNEKRLEQIERHLRWMIQQTAVAGSDLQFGVQGALELFALLPKPAEGARKPPGSYWHRTGPDDAWSIAQITPTGVLLFMGTDAAFSGEHALQYMTIGEWFRLPDPPGGQMAQS
jgi:hypothetical protein